MLGGIHDHGHGHTRRQNSGNIVSAAAAAARMGSFTLFFTVVAVAHTVVEVSCFKSGAKNSDIVFYSKEDFLEQLQGAFPGEDLDRIFDVIDVNDDGHIQFSESKKLKPLADKVANSGVTRKEFLDKNKEEFGGYRGAHDAFNMFDINKDNILNPGEMHQLRRDIDGYHALDSHTPMVPAEMDLKYFSDVFAGHTSNKYSIEEVFEGMDLDGNGIVSRQEFQNPNSQRKYLQQEDPTAEIPLPTFLKRYERHLKNPAGAEQVFNELDRNGNRMLNQFELLSLGKHMAMVEPLKMEL